jgi:flagellar biosynthesis/type III secretory pathway M-ring protein FliF/YscJ
VPHGIPIVRSSLEERLSSKGKNYAKIESNEDRGSDEREERVRAGPGMLARVTIAVIVDARRGLDLAKIREVAAAAGGIDRSRGDVLTVQSVPFDRPRPPEAGRYVAGALVAVAPALVCGVVAVVALRAGARPLTLLAGELARRARIGRTARDAERHRSEAAIFEALRGEPPYAAAAVIATLDAPLAAAVLDLYSTEERSAVVARLRAPRSPLADGLERLLHG